MFSAGRCLLFFKPKDAIRVAHNGWEFSRWCFVLSVRKASEREIVSRPAHIPRLRCRAGDTLVLGAIDALVRARDRQIEIIVRDNPGMGGVIAGQDRRMADRKSTRLNSSH